MGMLLSMGKFGCKLECWNRYYMRWFCLLCQNVLLNRLCSMGNLFTIIKQKTHKFTLQSGLIDCISWEHTELPKPATDAIPHNIDYLVGKKSL